MPWISPRGFTIRYNEKRQTREKERIFSMHILHACHFHDYDSQVTLITFYSTVIIVFDVQNYKLMVFCKKIPSTTDRYTAGIVNNKK